MGIIPTAPCTIPQFRLHFVLSIKRHFLALFSVLSASSQVGKGNFLGGGVERGYHEEGFAESSKKECGKYRENAGFFCFFLEKFVLRY